MAAVNSVGEARVFVSAPTTVRHWVRLPLSREALKERRVQGVVRRERRYKGSCNDGITCSLRRTRVASGPGCAPCRAFLLLSWETNPVNRTRWIGRR